MAKLPHAQRPTTDINMQHESFIFPGMEQKIMSTISDDQQAGVTYTMRVWRVKVDCDSGCGFSVVLQLAGAAAYGGWWVVFYLYL